MWLRPRTPTRPRLRLGPAKSLNTTLPYEEQMRAYVEQRTVKWASKGQRKHRRLQKQAERAELNAQSDELRLTRRSEDAAWKTKSGDKLKTCAANWPCSLTPRHWSRLGWRSWSWLIMAPAVIYYMTYWLRKPDMISFVILAVQGSALIWLFLWTQVGEKSAPGLSLWDEFGVHYSQAWALSAAPTSSG